MSPARVRSTPRDSYCYLVVRLSTRTDDVLLHLRGTGLPCHLAAMTGPAEIRLSRSELADAVWSEPLAQIAARVGMTANGLGKLCDRIDIPRPTRTFWNLSEAERSRLRRHLAVSGDPAEEVAFGEAPQRRRARTRLSPDDRKTQLLEIAATIVRQEGVAEVKMKRIAREAGITEAQAHNCFGKRIDLLLELTRRELAELERTRRDVVERGRDYTTAVVLSTVSYLDEAQARGPLLQALLMVPEVRAALSEERRDQSARASEPVLARMRRRYNFSDDEALCANSILSAITLRGGSLLANGRISHAVANRLVLSMVLAGMRSNAESARARGQPDQPLP